MVGQVRRNTGTAAGALVYNHSGTGTNAVTVLGVNQNSNRAVFEILNTGSVFNMSGAAASLTIARTGNSTVISDLYLYPATSSVTGGTINIGISGTGNTQTFDIQSNVTLNNLTVTGGSASNICTARLEGKPLSLAGNLTLTNSFSILDAATNSQNVTVGGNFINNGGSSSYLPGTGTTALTGASGQISGTATTTFNKLTVTGGITLAAASPNITINSTLTVNSGNSFTLAGATKAFTKGTVVNGGSITGTGTLSLNGTSNQQLSGSGGYVNVEMNNTGGATIMQSGTQLTGTLSFLAGILDIGSYNLLLGSSVTVSGSPDASKMIRTNGSFTDAGITKTFATGAQNFTFPVGSSGKYTPAQFNITANTAAGTITVVPVTSVHPGTVDPANTALSYFWNVSSTGFSGLSLTHTYTFSPSDINGTVSNYVTGRYLSGVWTPQLGIQYSPSSPTLSVNSGANTITLSGVSFLDGGYTAGYAAEFGAPTVFYSRIAGTRNWTNTTDAWSTDVILQHSGAASGLYPSAGNNADIAAGHTIYADVNSLSTPALSLNGTLDLNTSLSQNFGIVSGTGTLRISPTVSGSIVYPVGTFTSFMTAGGGTVEYYGSGSGTLPTQASYNYLTLSGSGTVAVPNLDITVNADLTINSGVLDNSINNRALTLLGNFTNNSSSSAFLPGSGSGALVTFSSSGAQSAGGSFATAFTNLTVNKPSGVLTLTAPASVSSALTLTNGIVTTTNTNLLTLGASATNSAGSSTAYINGPIALTGIGSKVFPVGAGTSGFFRPATLNITSGTNPVIRGTLLTGTAGGFDATLKHTSSFGWDMSLSSGSFSGGTLTVTYNASADKAGSPASLRVGYASSSSASATSIGPLAGGTGTTLTSNSISSLGFFRLGSTTETNLLPVTLLSFDGMHTKEGNLLTWESVNEINLAGYAVEKSYNGNGFIEIAYLPVIGSAEGASKKEYSFTDKTEWGTEKVYYRLKMLDEGGSFKYSPVVATSNLQTQPKPFFLIYPNPQRPGQNLHAEAHNFSSDNLKNIELINLHGQLSGSFTSTSTPDLLRWTEENLNTLKPGTYLIKISDGTYSQVSKFLKY